MIGRVKASNVSLQKLYIAVEKFDPSCGAAWDAYVNWSGLHQVVEIFGLDGMLNPSVLEVRDDYWDHIVNEDYMLSFFTDLEFMLAQLGDRRDLNVVGAIKAPAEDVSELDWAGFSFCGYELLDQDNANSALTNCGGFPDAFRTDELSRRGLVMNFDRAVQIQRDLRRFYPQEHHADCQVWALFDWQGLTRESTKSR